MLLLSIIAKLFSGGPRISCGWRPRSSRWHQPIFLPATNKVCEGYVFKGVFLSTGGVCPIACRDTHPPDKYIPRQVHPEAGTSPLGRCTPGQVHPRPGSPPGHVRSPGRYTPWVDTPCPVHAGIHTPLPSACSDTHPVCSGCWEIVNKLSVRIPLEWILVAILVRRGERAAPGPFPWIATGVNCTAISNIVVASASV